MIPEKVTAAWAHNEASVPADFSSRRLMLVADKIEGTLDLKG